jgi:spore germination protein YaaH
MPGVVGNCNRFYKIKSGDGCDSIAQKNSITPAQLKSWNTEINASCSNLWLDYYICTGVPGAVTTTSPPSPTAAAPMPGIVPGCTRYYQVVSGDSCDAIASKAGITVTTSASGTRISTPAAQTCGSMLWSAPRRSRSPLF